MQHVLATLTDKKNITHNDWLKERKEIELLSEQIEERKKKMENFLAVEKEVDTAIELVRGELDANAIGETTRVEGQPAKAVEEGSKEPEPKEEPTPVDDEVRPSEEPTPDLDAPKSDEEGKATSPVDTEQDDGK